MAGVLDGIRVVDMGHVVAVPAAGAMMADWGADVIKVEPLTGEMTRGLRRSLGVDIVRQLAGGEVSGWVEMLNRNKKGLALDLKQESGRGILYRLVKKSDVFATRSLLSAILPIRAR